MDDLTDRQLAILAFERQWWKRHPAAVRHLFDCTRAQYRAELAALIELPAAVAYDPLLVKRLRRATGRATTLPASAGTARSPGAAGR
jgi:hypothetical protein